MYFLTFRWACDRCGHLLDDPAEEADRPAEATGPLSRPLAMATELLPAVHRKDT